jgi:hypothetical protein
MSEPRRLLESSSAASRLLRAGLRDNPERHAARRAALVLGLGAASASAATGASAAGAASAAVTISGSAAAGAAASSVSVAAVAAKWMFVGLLGGTVAAGGATAIERLEPTAAYEERTEARSQRAVPTESPKPRTQAAFSLQNPEPSPPAAAPSAPDTPSTERRHSPTSKASAAVRERGPGTSPATANERGDSRPSLRHGDTGALGRDLAQIDATRRALKAGDATRAGELLDGYHRGRQTDFFEREALVLRIETLVQQGQHERAATLASRYFQRFPDDVHAHRIRGLLGIRPSE